MYYRPILSGPQKTIYRDHKGKAIHSASYIKNIEQYGIISYDIMRNYSNQKLHLPSQASTFADHPECYGFIQNKWISFFTSLIAR